MPQYRLNLAESKARVLGRRDGGVVHRALRYWARAMENALCGGTPALSRSVTWLGAHSLLRSRAALAWCARSDCETRERQLVNSARCWRSMNQPRPPTGVTGRCRCSSSREFTTRGGANPSDANRNAGPSTDLPNTVRPNMGRVSTNSGKDRTPTARLARRRQPAWRLKRGHPQASPTPCRRAWSNSARLQKPKQQFSG
jgi:hypothetical protein